MSVSYLQEATELTQQLTDAKTALSQSQQQAAQQLATFQSHVYETLGQTRVQHQSQLDRLLEQLAEQRQQISRMASAAEASSRAAEAAVHVADCHIAGLEAVAERKATELVEMQQEMEAHRQETASMAASAEAAAHVATGRICALEAAARQSSAELVKAQQAGDGQREQLAALQMLVACQGLGASRCNLQSRTRLALLRQEIASLKARQPVYKNAAEEPARLKPCPSHGLQGWRPCGPASHDVLKDITIHHNTFPAAEAISGALFADACVQYVTFKVGGAAVFICGIKCSIGIGSDVCIEASTCDDDTLCLHLSFLSSKLSISSKPVRIQ